MTTSIFIRSYSGDKQWLSFCLRSLKKYAEGFREIVVAIPRLEEALFEGFDFHGARRLLVNDPDCPGYIGQQCCKLEADLHTDADFIVFIDSDCVAHKKFGPDEFFNQSGKQAKPIQLIRHWAGFKDESKKWRSATEQFIGFDAPFEHMATLPLVYDRHSLRLFRDYLAATHHKVLWEYVKNPSTHSMSEFNGLGAFSHRFTPQLYDWRVADPEKDGYPRPLHQHWSYGGITPEMEDRFESYIAGNGVKEPQKLLLAIHGYPGANATVVRHWPLYMKAGADEIFGISTLGGGCVWPDFIRSMEIGENRYMDGKSDHLCRRLLDTLEGFLPLEWDRLCIVEYDAVFFHSLPRDLPPGIIAHLSGGTPAGCTCSQFFHCPWIFDRESAKRAIEVGRKMIADGDIQLGSPDCFLGRMQDRSEIRITDCPFPVYSRNSLDIPWQLEEAKQAVKAGAFMIHGVKNEAQLAALIE